MCFSCSIFASPSVVVVSIKLLELIVVIQQWILNVQCFRVTTLPIKKEVMRFHFSSMHISNLKIFLIFVLSVKIFIAFLHLTRFPSTPTRKQNWLDSIGRPELRPVRSARVCSKHFDEKYFVQNGDRVTLKKDAVPFPLVILTISVYSFENVCIAYLT